MNTSFTMFYYTSRSSGSSLAHAVQTLDAVRVRPCNAPSRSLAQPAPFAISSEIRSRLEDKMASLDRRESERPSLTRRRASHSSTHT